MSTFQCFVVKPTDLCNIHLRRLSFTGDSKRCPVSGGSHSSSTYFRTMPAKDTFGYNKETDEVHQGDFFSHSSNHCWINTCRCGYRFSPLDEWQYFPERLYARLDTGVVLPLDQQDVGALWRSRWLESGQDSHYYCGEDGHSWSLRTPLWGWHIDSKSVDCTNRWNLEHKCWSRKGIAPNFTIYKGDGACYSHDGVVLLGGQRLSVSYGVLTVH